MRTNKRYSLINTYFSLRLALAMIQFKRTKNMGLIKKLKTLASQLVLLQITSSILYIPSLPS